MEPRLIADIGGTFARFALETAPGKFEATQSLECAQFADFAGALRHYLDSATKTHIRHAAIAIANPVSGDEVRMTNYHWQFSIEAVRKKLGLETLVVVNDFTALAMAVPKLRRADQRRAIGEGVSKEASVIGVLGAGSGLGVSGLIPADRGWVALGTEGGHASVAPRNSQEAQILQFAWRQYEHVSFERLLSASGIELMYRALANLRALTVEPLSAPEITRRALAHEDELCVDTTEQFCLFMGTAASNLALTLGALGGVFIGGGIVPRLGDFFDQSGFRARFENKGRFSKYLQQIPTFIITEPQATFIGASAILGAQLSRLRVEGRSDLLERIERDSPNLSNAEQKVAQYVVSHARQVLTAPVAEIAANAQVSQPTVIRFCRSMGNQGLADFKLRLASELRGVLPLTHVQVQDDDSAAELASKVLSNTASAILSLRDRINQSEMMRAVNLLDQCQRIDIFASGQYTIVARDAQFKFLRLGIPSASYEGDVLTSAAASTTQAGTLMMFFSSKGEIPALVQAAQSAKSKSIPTIAVTAPASSLARAVDVSMAVEHSEDMATQVPMVSRILHLLIIDILTVSLAMLRANRSEANTNEPVSDDMLDSIVRTASQTVTTAAQADTLGVSTSHQTATNTLSQQELSELSSHSRSATR